MGRVKGSTLLGAVKFLRSRRREAIALLAAEHRHYLDDTIKTSAWYPLGDLLVLVGACADALGTGREQAFSFMGEFAARAHAEVYGDLMHVGGSNSRTFALWSTQFDAGRMQHVIEAPGRTRVELCEFKAPGLELCLLIGGYIKGVVAQSDVKDLSVEKTSCTTRGDLVCAWRVTWKRDDE